MTLVQQDFTGLTTKRARNEVSPVSVDRWQVFINRLIMNISKVILIAAAAIILAGTLQASPRTVYTINESWQFSREASAHSLHHQRIMAVQP